MQNIFDYNEYLIMESNTYIKKSVNNIIKYKKNVFVLKDSSIQYNTDATIIANNITSVNKKVKPETKFILFQLLDIFDSKLLNNFPETIEGIIFESDSDSNFDLFAGKLPSELRLLVFDSSTIDSGSLISKFINNLPSKLEFLQLETEDFNQPINNLPQKIKVLMLGDNFSQSVDNLPESLIGLKLGRKFSQSIDNLPTNLVYLNICINKYSNKNLNFPLNLKFLKINFTNKITYKNCNKIYDSILKIKYPQVKHLVLNYKIYRSRHYIEKQDDVTNIKHCIENLPESLEYLEISFQDINWNLSKLPANIKQIKIFNIESENGLYKMRTRTVIVFCYNLL